MTDNADYVMGIDLSTQSVTVEVRDASTFARVGRASAALPSAVPPDAVQNPSSWWASLVRATQDLNLRGINLQRVVAVSVAGQCHGLVALNANSKVIRPAPLWNNTVGTPYIKQLIEQLGPERWVLECGTVPKAAFTIAKLAWLVNTEPDTVNEMRKILVPHDYVNFRLTGRFTTDRSDASGTGYFNSQNNRWCVELLRDCFGEIKDWEGMLPEVLGPEEVAGFVSEEAANQLGIRAGIVVGPGGGDQHLAAAGIGLRPRDVCFSLGTSGVVFTISEVPIADVTGMVDGVASATGTWQPLVCTQNFTQVTDLFAKLMGIDVAELGELALQADRSRERPVLAPYLGGERSPNYPHGTGILTGISYGMDRSQLALVLIEGILLGLVRGLREINRQNVDTSGRVIAIGGAASSPGIVQILADLLERPINILDSPEATVRGACLQALAVLRGATFSQLCDEYAPQLGKLVTPREGPTWPNLYSEYMHTADLAGTWGK